ncbi:MAG: S1C family serine protease [Treponema sp.]|uniref:S1C family serine protease n=1 Tax=Treponema sp. TaxID=166 RepID=UPI00298E00E9|nr:S1C family serine protease [Treponema sp.]MCR5387481.1 S1C family serine protease [Treponema sp.]
MTEKKLLSIILCTLVFFSCTSTKLNVQEKNEDTSDYSLEDIRKNEIERTRNIVLTRPCEALWNSVLLQDEELIEYTSKYVRDYCASEIEQKDYLEAFFAWQSLVNAGFEKLASSVITKSELDKLFYNNIPGTGVKKNTTPKENISSCIAGTVTIWVDLGVKIKSGVGFANRVIGSGFFIDERGYIITNHHVISEVVDPKYEGYGKVYIKLAGNEDDKIPAKVIGWDKIHDLALLKTEIKPPYVFPLGSSSDLKPGDRVYAIGSPLGLESTLTSGVVSSTNRRLFTTGTVLQIDAAVNSGNSGGPCIDVNGNVQAVVFSGILQYQGLNFAIPVEYIKQEIAILYYGGNRRLPWIGGYGHTYKIGNKEAGLEVEYFSPNSAMAKAGIKRGDVITAVDGKSVKNISDIQTILRDYIPETIVKCEYLDSNKSKKSCILYLTERPKAPGYHFYKNDTIQNSFVPLFGISMIPSSTTNSRTFLVTNVLKRSTADETGISENDPITVGKIQFNDDKTMMMAEISVKRRKKGYLDMTLGLTTTLDSPYYF